jgi:hypothetical protein
MSILDSVFTFGMEIEPGQLQINVKPDQYLERQTIWRSSDERLDATAEAHSLGGDSCPFNLELVTSVYTYDRISDFLKDDKDTEDMFHSIKSNLQEFMEDYFINNIDILRIGKKRTKEQIKQLGKSVYKNCNASDLSDILTEADINKIGDNERFEYYERFDEKQYIDVRSQLTIGVNYAFFTPILDCLSKKGRRANEKDLAYRSLSLFDKLINRIIPLYCGRKKENILKIEMNKFKDDSHKQEYYIFKGFMLLLIYTSYMLNLPSKKYLKSNFSIKPRSNFLYSYIILKQDYPIIEKYIDLFFDAIYMLVDNDKQTFKVDINGEKYTPFEEVKDIINGKEETVPAYMTQHYLQPFFLLIKEEEEKQRKDSDKLGNYYDNSVYLYMLNILTRCRDIKYWKKCFRIKKFKKDISNSIGHDNSYNCIIKDGYYYDTTFYIKQHGNITPYYIDDNIDYFKHDYIEGDEYDFVYYTDLPYLRYGIPKLIIEENGKLCTHDSNRVELFELIPDNPNMIIEFRDPNAFIKKSMNSSIEDSLNNMKEFFDLLKIIFSKYLNELGLLNFSFKSKAKRSTRKSVRKSKKNKSVRKSKRKSLRKNKRSLRKSKRKSKKNLRKSKK